MRQDGSSLNTADSVIDPGAPADLYVNFTFDTSGRNVYLVYTTNGTAPTKSNGTVVNASFSRYDEPDRLWVATIPGSANIANQEVRYVFYISNSTLANGFGRVAGTDGAGSQYQTTWVEGDNYFSYTPRVLAVELAAFTATAQSDHVLVAWETASEMDALGFNLYRSTDPATVGEQLNEGLIPAAASGGSQGASYEWADEEVVAGTTYHYWLEDVSTTGATTMHGPASVAYSVPTAVTLDDFGAGRSPAWPLAAGLAMAGLAGAAAWRRARG